jgi:hypothetical protein
MLFYETAHIYMHCHYPPFISLANCSRLLCIGWYFCGCGGSGVKACMGFYYVVGTPGTAAVFENLLHTMKERNMPDEPAANSILWFQGLGRSRDVLDPDPWFGTVYNSTVKFALLPQSRYQRHAGIQLASLPPGTVDLHMFHPVDEGYAVPFTLLPRFGLRKGEPETTLQSNATMKEHCGIGKWFEKTVFRTREQDVQICAGLWLLNGVYKYGNKAHWPRLADGEDWFDWLSAQVLPTVRGELKL